jgi:hypothetical protein
MQVELKKLKFGLLGREGIKTFQCEVHYNGKFIANCREDGNGGMLSTHIVQPFDETRPILAAIKEWSLTQPSIYRDATDTTSMGDFDEQIINLVIKAETMISVKKNQLKYICYFENKSDVLQRQKLGNNTIAQVLSDTRGVVALKSAINKIQTEGGKILNTNLGECQSLVK